MTTELGEAVARCKNLTRDGRDINTVNVNCDDLETILAELGRLSSDEPVAEIVGEERQVNGYAPILKWNFDWSHRQGIDIGDKLYTRPPALGELSDEVLLSAKRWDALVSCKRIRMLGWAGLDLNGDPIPERSGYVHFGAEFWTHHDAATADPLAKIVLERFADAAAREFLGNVDG